VCLLANTRAYRLTFPSFKRQVLDQLNGDLALALAIDDKYDYSNPFWQHAKYRWTAPDFRDYGEAFDLVQRWLCQQHSIPAPDWRSLLPIGGIWQGGIGSLNPQPSATSIMFFCRWLLLHNLQQDGVLERYDRFVITRSDFVWLCPHPPLSILDRGAIWIPNGEHYGGLNDRHLVVSRTDVVNCLNLVEDMLLEPEQLYEELKYMKDRVAWQNNIEQFLAHHLRRKELFHKVQTFPYVMYLAREVGDESRTWSRGHYEPAIGHYVKYDREFRMASAYATIINSRADWEAANWRQFDPALIASRPVSGPRRVSHALARHYYRAMSAARRPGRAGRFLQFCKRTLNAD
jgi:hypothetical protein